VRFSSHVKTAWESAVLKAHDVKPQRTATGGLSIDRQAKLAEIDLHFHDLRHEAGSASWRPAGRCTRSARFGHANVTTTARYLNVTRIVRRV